MVVESNFFFFFILEYEKMNRRIFLQQPLLFFLPTRNSQPAKRDVVMFESNNKRMTAKMTFIDYDSQVLMINEKVWYDPITNDIKNDTTRQMFILESYDT